MDTVKGGTPGEDIQLINRLPAQEGAEQSAQAQDVIEVSMREKDAREILEARTGLQDLALGPLAAVDQKTIFIMLDNLCREPALCRGRRGGSAKKKYFEQNGILW